MCASRPGLGCPFLWTAVLALLGCAQPRSATSDDLDSGAGRGGDVDARLTGGTGGTTGGTGGTDGTGSAGRGSGSASGGSAGAAGSVPRTDAAAAPPNTDAAAAPPLAGHKLKVQAMGNGEVVSDDGALHCPGVCEATFSEGQKVVLRARPRVPSSFRGWVEKDLCAGRGECTLTIDRDRSVTARFLHQGQTVWTQSLADVRAMTVMGDTVYAAGMYDKPGSLAGLPVPAPQGRDAFLAAFSFDGVPRWVHTFGGTDDDEFLALVPTQDGRLLGGLELRAPATFGTISLKGPTPMAFYWAMVAFSGSGDPLSGVLMPAGAGSKLAPGLAAGQLYSGNLGSLVRLNEAGQALDPVIPVPAFLDEIRVDRDGNVLVSGGTRGKSMIGTRMIGSDAGGTAYVGKFRGNTLVWVTAFQGTGDQEDAWSVTVDDAGEVYVAGHFSKQLQVGSASFVAKGMSDLFVARLASASGQVVWAKQFGGAGDDGEPTVAVASGRLFFSAGFTPGTDLGGGITVSGYGFIAELRPEDGSPIWADGEVSRGDGIALAGDTLFVGGGGSISAVVP